MARAGIQGRGVLVDLHEVFGNARVAIGTEQRARRRLIKFAVNCRATFSAFRVGAFPSMNLRQLEVFHAIMRTGSVTAAAPVLHVSQPAFSAGLEHTEQRLQFKLFEPICGRLHPTNKAGALLPDVMKSFGRVDMLGAWSRTCAPAWYWSVI